MTRLELRNASRKRLGETTSAFWTDTEINDYINQACKDLAWRSKCLRAVGYLPVSSCTSNTVAAASNEVTISTTLSTFFAINEAYFLFEGDNWVRMDPTFREELDIRNPLWQNLVGVTTTSTAGVTTYNSGAVCGVPTMYYWNREEDVFGVYPPANADNSGSNYVKVYYTKNHTDLSADTSSPTLPTPLHPAIVDYVAATGLEDRGWGERANDMWMKYYKKINDYKVESRVEREDDNIVSKNYRNI
jgi:hypothetical protein